MEPVAQLNESLTGRYEIEREIGRGGMATVYLARDARHYRRVALKVLNPDLAAVVGPERFLAEIRVTSQLQHPHLLPLFDSGEATLPGSPPGSGLLFYVMPYVAGESLRSRLAREKQLPIDEAVRIAVAVASALEYAHQHGVIHRDLKPENILLQAGQPVVADFGIALAVSNAGGSRITQTGISLGTPHYMSPEQATGDRTIDARSDIYSLGAVLYEMLTGDPPHHGATAQAIIARLLTEKPRPIRATRENVPPFVEAATLRALEKLPADRFASAREFGVALQRSGDTVAAPERVWESDKPGRSRRVGALWLSAALVVGALLGVATDRALRLQSSVSLRGDLPVLRTSFELPSDAPLALAAQPASGYNSRVLDVSPDGTELAYVAQTASGTMLYVRDMSTGLVRALPGTEGAVHPFYSPDGQWLGFLTADHVKKVPHGGGTVISLCQANTPVLARWTTSNRVYFTENETFILSEVSADGGTPQRVLTVGELGVLRFIDVLPEGDWALVTRGSSVGENHADILLANLRTKELRVVVRSAFAPRYVAPGFLLFARSGSLLAARFDESRKQLVGEPVTLASNVSMESLWGMLQAAASSKGLLAYVAGGDLSVGRIAWVDRQGTVDYLADAPERIYGQIDLAPDGNHIAAHVADVQDYLWVWNITRREGQRVMNAESEGWPVWSRDGRRLAGGVVYVPPVHAVMHDVDGSGAVSAGTRVSNSGFEPEAFSPAGDLLAVLTSLSPFRTGFTGLTGPVKLPEFEGLFPDFGPDGRWIAYVSTRSGTGEIFIRSFPDGKIERQVSSDGGIELRWLPSGELFFRKGRQWFSTHVVTTPELSWDRPSLAFDTEFIDTPGMSYDVSRDGQRLLVVKRAHAVGASRIEIVTNWTTLVDRAR
jgi:serine/threonine-protein kinase